jgi:hypothetical protein
VKGDWDKTISARYGHKSVFILPSTIFIFGGINELGQVSKDMYIYKISDSKFYPLKKKFQIQGGLPKERAHYSMIHIANGLIALYGGIDS